MSQPYKFTQDWFHWAPAVWEQIVPILPERKRVLELGAFEGRSTVWIVDNMLEDGGTLFSVDTWQGAEEHVASQEDMLGVEKHYDNNHALLKFLHPARTVHKIKSTSYEALAFLVGKPAFDFIYIDASHTAPDVLTDACMAWPLLKSGGVMVFDDYLWDGPTNNARDILHRPKLAIDAFANIFCEQIRPVHTGYQYAIAKHFRVEA